MMTPTYMNINPHVLRWAREKAHYTEDQLSKQLGVSVERYQKWESGDVKPTLKQLYKLVNRLNRSVHTFYLNEIPDEPEILPELRRLPGRPAGQESPEFIKQFNYAIERRALALRLYQGLGEKPPPFILTAHISENPQDVAQRVRDAIGVTNQEQDSWVDDYQALRSWRFLLERSGVLVFQIPYVSLQEMRGFSIAYDPLPIVGFNSRDYPKPRIFSLIHEFAHLLLGDKILHDASESLFHFDSAFRTESFCNRVAASIIIPQEDLEAAVKDQGFGFRSTWTDSEIRALSARFKISRAVVLRRLNELNLISGDSFFELRPEYDSAPPIQHSKETSGGNPYLNRIYHIGPLLSELAFKSYYEGNISASSLSSIFNLQVKYLASMEEKVFGSSYAFGGP